MSAKDEPVEVTDDNFDDIVGNDGLVIVDCWAPWCAPCLMLGPVMEGAAKDYAGKLVIGKLNVDHSGQTAQKFGIMSIPTILFFKDGEKVDQITGVIPREHLDKMIEKHM